MSTAPDGTWIVILGLALGSFALRFSFIGLVGDRRMPAWVLRHLRYTAVAILPALVAPAAVWPTATGGALDPPRLAASAVTLAVGLTTRNVIFAMLSGAATLYGLIWLLG
ncbi:Branched-chain amino acid transport protein [Cribrihabitans marinus]|uniref:Branched-chain amino acid transport protein n=1 Tax=Cribrihabitans marinus TaxID=1227549 RepID=A0A1H7CDV4_9RHOB|nr:AzlD domain-containing protein [Cribrihabitans marinus]GGH35179.1 membrane protein [Cribrihabitans marinus]SEJ87656.1 Branched-chain amino acid transport protein [Cribrihabitans marinus]